MESEDSRIYGKPGHLIRRLQQISVAIFVAQSQKFRVTPVQYSAVLATYFHPGIDQTTLCNIIAFDRSTIGDVVARLQAKRLIKRVSARTDKRRRLLYITPRGRRLIHDIEPTIELIQKSILAPLRPNERRLFMEMLKRLVHINNKHSRAPQRPQDTRPRRRHSGSRMTKPARNTVALDRKTAENMAAE
jgi:MarR family transcriptional regulator, lower aerobic nicotinate degradation pathway regulator